MMKRGPVRSAFPYMSRDDIAGIGRDLRRILESGRLILGPFLERFEHEFASYVGVRHAIGISSCTAALEAVLRYIDVKGGEVIVPTNTFVASANAVLYAGGTPVFCDIERASLALDVADMKAKITPRTRAVLIVHLGGNVSTSVFEIKNECESKGIPLVEDGSHAHGASIDGRRVGSIGMAGCFSMYPTKVMTTAGGGVVTTSEARLAGFCSLIRHHGAGSAGLTVPDIHGNDWLMNEIAAAIGLRQLARLESNLAARGKIAEAYRRGIERIRGVSNLPASPRVRNSYYKYIAVIDGDRGDVPRVIADVSKKHQVELAQLYFPPCHMQPIFRKWASREKLPNAEDVVPRSVALPVHVALSRKEISRVLTALRLVTAHFASR